MIVLFELFILLCSVAGIWLLLDSHHVCVFLFCNLIPLLYFTISPCSAASSLGGPEWDQKLYTKKFSLGINSLPSEGKAGQCICRFWHISLFVCTIPLLALIVCFTLPCLLALLLARLLAFRNSAGHMVLFAR